jgi:phage terminase Nu1 subunit (DNA packaging protein)
VSEPERYVDGRELGWLLGVSVSTVKRWRKEGCPAETWGMARTVRYLPSRVIVWRREHAAAADDSRQQSAPTDCYFSLQVTRQVKE